MPARSWTLSRLVAVATVLVAGLIGGLVLVIVGVAYARGSSDAGADFLVYRDGIASFWSGTPIYPADGTVGFTYPPSAAALLTPLGLGSPRGAAVAWLIVNVLSLGLIAALLATLVDRSPARGARALVMLPDAVVVLAVAATWAALWPYRFGLLIGQVGIALTLMVVVDLVLIRRGHRAAGVLTGLAVAIKLTPALFIAWFWLRDDRRPAYVATATAAATMALVAIARPQDTLAYLSGQGTSALLSSTAIPALANQSVVGALARLLDLDGLPVEVIAVVCASTATVGLFCATRLHRAGAPVSAVAVIGITSAAAVPVGWAHAWTWLPILAVAAAIEVRDRVVAVTSVAVVAMLALLVPGTNLPLFLPAGSSAVLRIASAAYVLGALALIVVTLRRARVRARLRAG